MRIDEIAISYVMSNPNLLMEDRIQFLKDNTKKLDTSHDTTAEHQETPDIIQHFADHGDPTKNKVHTQYLVGLYKNKQIRQEDTDRLHTALSNFEKYKTKLSPQEKQVNLKNYPHISDLEAKVKPFLGTAVTNSEKQQELRKQADDSLPGHEKKFEDDKIKIFHLKDADTSKKLYASTNDKTPGAVKPTEWCTARDTSNNMFDRYHKDGPLFVVHRKSDGAVFQYHPHSAQFMDAEDKPINKEDFLSIHKSLHKAWEKHPELESDDPNDPVLYPKK